MLVNVGLKLEGLSTRQLNQLGERIHLHAEKDNGKDDSVISTEKCEKYFVSHSAVSSSVMILMFYMHFFSGLENKKKVQKWRGPPQKILCGASRDRRRANKPIDTQQAN